MPHKLHSLTFHDDDQGPTPVHLPDCISHSLDMDPRIEKEISASESSPTHASMVARDFMEKLETFAIKTLLDTIGVRGAAINTGGGNPGVVLNLQQFDACGDPVAGASHRTYTIKKGLVVPKSLKVDHQGNAKLEFEAAIIPDGVNAAVIAATGATLPTITVVSARWTLGPAKIAGVTYTDLDSFEIDFGNEVEKRGADSDIDDGYIEQRTHSPVITLRGINQAWPDAIDIDGKIAAHATTKFYLRKRDGVTTDAGFVADNVAEHISFTIAGPATMRTLSQGESQKFAEAGLAIDGMKDGAGNLPLIVDTATTIT